jgi:hypothetical protein
MFNDSVRNAQWTQPCSVMKTRQLMLYREIIADCSEICIEHRCTLWAERGIFFLLNLYIRGHAVAQRVEALRYKPECRGFDS